MLSCIISECCMNLGRIRLEKSASAFVTVEHILIFIVILFCKCKWLGLSIVFSCLHKVHSYTVN